MAKDKIEEFVVVYETCPRSKFGPSRDWSATCTKSRRCTKGFQ
jgi:hypothetical protein